MNGLLGRVPGPEGGCQLPALGWRGPSPKRSWWLEEAFPFAGGKDFPGSAPNFLTSWEVGNGL